MRRHAARCRACAAYAAQYRAAVDAVRTFTEWDDLDFEEALDPPLLVAIADGTFGSMKRPATKGKGLDGVVRKADGYDNPATTMLEEGATR